MCPLLIGCPIRHLIQAPVLDRLPIWSITAAFLSFLEGQPLLLYLQLSPVLSFTCLCANLSLINRICLFVTPASISASSNPSSSSVSANLLDGMVCVNDTYMLPGRNNLSITVVTDPQRTAAINRGVTAASPAVPVVASSSAPAIPATSTTASTATSPSNAITISRTASEMEHKKQLLINPLTGTDPLTQFITDSGVHCYICPLRSLGTQSQ
jgi:hypothetical protein